MYSNCIWISQLTMFLVGFVLLDQSVDYVFSGVRVTGSVVLCVCFVDLPFVPFPLAIVLYVLLRITASGYPFDIFKFFF